MASKPKAGFNALGGAVGGSGRREDILVDNMKGKLQGASAGGGGYDGGRMGDGDATSVPIGTEQRYERLQQINKGTNENLVRAIQTSERTNDIGYTTIQELGRQRETIQRTKERVDEVGGNLQQAQQVIRDIRMGVYKEWICKGLVIAVMVLIIIFLFYAKFLK